MLSRSISRAIGLLLKSSFCNRRYKRSAQLTEAQIIYLEAVELMTVDRDVPQPVIQPVIVLVDAHTHQVRHDVGESVIVIAFHPHNFDIALGVGELADVAEELPVFFGEAGEVEVGKDVAQQDQPLKTVFLEHARGFTGVTSLCTEVQVGKDQRVVDMQIHSLVVAGECYGVMKHASKSVHGNYRSNRSNLSVNKGFNQPARRTVAVV